VILHVNLRDSRSVQQQEAVGILGVNLIYITYHALGSPEGGTLLEGIARLFTQNLRVGVYRMAAEEVQKRVMQAGLTGWRWKETDGLVSPANLHRSGALDFFYQYLLGSEFILPGKPLKS
jgi:hypothetical protein